MAVKTKFFTFKESELYDACLPIGCAIHSARVYVDIDQTVLVELFCSYEERPENMACYLNLIPAVDGTEIKGQDIEIKYVCPLHLPDGRIGGLFQIV